MSDEETYSMYDPRIWWTDSLRPRVLDAFWSYWAPSKRMDIQLSQLICSPTLSMDVDVFFYTLWTGALVHGHTTQNMKVTKIEYRKKKPPPGHEYMFMAAAESGTSGRGLAGPSQLSLTGEASFIVERTVEVDPAQSQNDDVESFLNHPECKKILAIVCGALCSTSSTILVAGVAAAVAGASPAVVSVAGPLSMAPIFFPSSSNTSSLPISEPSSIVDRGSLTIIQIFDHLSKLSSVRASSKAIKLLKPPKNAPADDRWVSGHKAATPEYADLEKERKAFHPLNLTVLHMALLIAIIHRQYPVYSLFKRNCFWFAALIFTAAKILDKVLHKGPTEYPEDYGDPDPEIPEISRGMVDFFFLPLFLLSEDSIGRYMGFKVCEVKSIVVDRIVELFLKELDELECKVGHYF